jgi:hypothetical protein
MEAAFRNTVNIYVEFEVLTAVVMKSSVVWDITPVDFQRTTWRYIEEDKIFPS